jgi:hypothetical protein
VQVTSAGNASVKHRISGAKGGLDVMVAAPRAPADGPIGDPKHPFLTRAQQSGFSGPDFPQHDEGILRRTHLRFFTRKSIVRLLESRGFAIQRIEGSNA